MVSNFKKIVSSFKNKKRNKALVQISIEVKNHIENIDLPIIIVSYNNHSYVKNMTMQLNKFNIIPIIIDNYSTNEKSIKCLHELNNEKKAFVIFSPINFGYRVGFMSPIYEVLPQFFGYTDPDLKFKDHIPYDFINKFKLLTEKYKIYKVGCALELSNKIDENIFMEIKGVNKPFQLPPRKFSVYEWESRYWNIQIKDDFFELYSAPIDTTFAVYNKKYYFSSLHDAIRVAGDYAVFHLPWYNNMGLIDIDELTGYNNKNNSNTWKRKSYKK